MLGGSPILYAEEDLRLVAIPRAKPVGKSSVSTKPQAYADRS